MNQLSEALNITATEHRHDFMCDITARFVDSLENQGFTFDEVLDGLVNYAWVNAYSADTVCDLVKSSLSAKKKHG